jgi:hypothetical protein
VRACVCMHVCTSNIFMLKYSILEAERKLWNFLNLKIVVRRGRYVCFLVSHSIFHIYSFILSLRRETKLYFFFVIVPHSTFRFYSCFFFNWRKTKFWCILYHCIPQQTSFIPISFYPDDGLDSKARYLYCPMDRSAVFYTKIHFHGKLRYLFLEIC